ncbi:MAG TPA: AMP-binding protein, partial [Candidatus Acidoferrales bacterium]|nr:AMP-binding protein [Candidatus Acidoferrales bacterium]
PPLPGVEVRVVGPDRNAVRSGDAGELWVRGPNVMKGYYKDPQQTAAAIDSEGWFKTGDLVRMEEGNLFIVGRSKELIIRYGFNVHPAEVESVLNLHPALARSAVVGRSVPSGDEEIIAFVQCRQDASVTAAELSSFVAKHLAPYKMPSQFVFVSEFPVTSTGKIIKGELAKRVAITTTQS